MKHSLPQSAEIAANCIEVNLALGASGQAPLLFENLQALQDHYRSPDCEHPHCAAIISALNTIARVLGCNLDQLPAGGAALRQLLNEGLPAVAGVTRKRWMSVLALLRRGLRDAGARVAMARNDTPLSESWTALIEKIEGDRVKIGVSRLVRYASEKGIEPEDFTLEVFEQFCASLEQGAISGDPAKIGRSSARGFNAAGARVSGWPQVTLPVSANPNLYSFAWDGFLPSFVADVDAMSEQDEVDDVWEENGQRALRPTTRQNRRYMVRMLASAMIQSGKVTVRDLTSLADLVKMENVQIGLAQLSKRAGGPTPYHLAFLYLAGTIARHYVKDEALARRLRSLHTTSKGRIEGATSKGLKQKNRKRLRQLDNPENVEALLALPARVHHRVSKVEKPTHADAVMVMRAVQVALLTCAPIRLKNLVGLRIGTSFVDFGKGGHRRVRIELTERETKTQIDYSAPVAKRFHPLIDAWIDIYRPIICSVPSDYLFPSNSGGMRNKGSVGTYLKGFIQRETGMVINPHLFRHWSAKVILEADPNNIEGARQLLSHSTTKTTLQAYAEFQTDPAFHRLEAAQSDRALAALRETRRGPKAFAKRARKGG